MSKAWSGHTLDYYSTTKRSEVPAHATDYMNLKRSLLTGSHTGYDPIYLKYPGQANPQTQSRSVAAKSGEGKGVGNDS